MKIFSILFNIILVLVLALIIVLPFTKNTLLFQPTRKIDKFPSDYGIPFSEVTILTKDDIKLSAWNIPSKNYISNQMNGDMQYDNEYEYDYNRDINDIILFCHGNGGNISHRKSLISIFHKLGYSMFIFDYRGYGRSTGSASVDGFYKDIETVWDYLTKIKGINEKNIILFGESIGVSVASYIAQRNNPKCLILQSGFASLGSIIDDYLPTSTPRVLLKFINDLMVGDDFNTMKFIKNITQPKLILHSLSDDIIPFYHSQILYDACLQPKEFYEIKGSHNDFAIDKLYIEEIDKFIKTSNIIIYKANLQQFDIPEIEYFDEEKTKKRVNEIIQREELFNSYSPNPQVNTAFANDETSENGIVITDSNSDELSSDEEERLLDILDELSSDEDSGGEELSGDELSGDELSGDELSDEDDSG